MENGDLISRIQESLRRAGLQAWLFYGFHELDPIAIRILRFPHSYHATRRWFYLVPAQGVPRKLVHRIESGMLDHLPGDKSVYLRWQELSDGIRTLLADTPSVAMQVSEIPAVSRVDAGTVDAIRGTGTEVVTSQTLVQDFESVWSAQQLGQHEKAAEWLTAIVRDAYEMVADRIRRDCAILEWDVQDFILDRFQSAGLVTDARPIVGVNGNAGNPHYSPPEQGSTPIRARDFLLIDLWAKDKAEGSVFADITWDGYFGAAVPDEMQKVFDIVAQGRDRGFELLEERFAAGRPVEGWEVDDAVREVIRAAGYEDRFVHRTGHNLGEETHGNGVNFDNLETHDTRRVINGIGCTIEPGIYLENFGVRSEINVYMSDQGPRITTPPQREILRLGV